MDASQCNTLTSDVVTRQRDSADVLITKAMLGSTACWTDHRLIRAKLTMQIAPKDRNQHATRRRFDVSKLKVTEISHQFQQNLEERLSDTPNENLSINDEWTSLGNNIKVCKETLGYQTKHNQHWFDDNDTTIKDLIDKKRAAFMDCQNHQNCYTRKAKHQLLRADVLASPT